jgi:hypothetical protein
MKGEEARELFIRNNLSQTPHNKPIHIICKRTLFFFFPFSGWSKI